MTFLYENEKSDLAKARFAFIAAPRKKTAGAFLRVILQAQGDDVLNDDEALNLIYDVTEYLEHGTRPSTHELPSKTRKP